MDNKIYEIKAKVKAMDKGFKYMLLDRMRTDILYYLGNGCRNVKHLWALNEKEHITYMILIYKSFKKSDKPQWLKLSDIRNYKKKMGV